MLGLATGRRLLQVGSNGEWTDWSGPLTSSPTTRLKLAKKLIASLPQIVTASTSPLSHIDDIKIVDFGSGGHNGNGNGASGGPVDRLLSISPASLTRVDETLKSTLGFGVKDLMPERVRDAVLEENGSPASSSLPDTTDDGDEEKPAE